MNLGYDSYSQSAFTPGNQARRWPEQPMDQAWIKWRADKFQPLMVHLHKAVKAKKANAIVSVSPNYYDFAYKCSCRTWLGLGGRNNHRDEVIVAALTA